MKGPDHNQEPDDEDMPEMPQNSDTFGFPQGNNGQEMTPPERSEGQGMTPPNPGDGQTENQADTWNSYTCIVLGVCVAVLLTGLLNALFYKRISPTTRLKKR